MKEARFYQGREGATCVLKLVGSLSWQVSQGLDKFLNETLEDQSVESFFVDLTEATYIDSTNLGLIARLYVHRREHGRPQTVLLTTQPRVNSILGDVGFDVIFEYADSNPYTHVELTEISRMGRLPPLRMAHLMHDAHTNLAGLNEHNRATFGPIVQNIAEDIESQRKKRPK
jgi:anti-anti-sigma factor